MYESMEARADRKALMELFREYKKMVIKALGRAALTSDAIDAYCGRVFGAQWGGCAMAHDKLAPGRVYLINTSYRGPGVHWCAIVREGDRAYVYDSFGRRTSMILPEIARRYTCIESDHRPEQHSGSLCGQDSIAWLIIARVYGVDNALLI